MIFVVVIPEQQEVRRTLCYKRDKLEDKQKEPKSSQEVEVFIINTQDIIQMHMI